MRTDVSELNRVPTGAEVKRSTLVLLKMNGSPTLNHPRNCSPEKRYFANFRISKLSITPRDSVDIGSPSPLERDGVRPRYMGKAKI